MRRSMQLACIRMLSVRHHIREVAVFWHLWQYAGEVRQELNMQKLPAGVQTGGVGMGVVSIHQPCYIPYLGIFYKIWQSDKFVYLDDAQYSNGYVFDWNRIKTHRGNVD